jgi:hypothetical protein
MTRTLGMLLIAHIAGCAYSSNRCRSLPPTWLALDDDTPIGSVAEQLARFDQPWSLTAETVDGEMRPVTLTVFAADTIATYTDNTLVTHKTGVPIFGYSTNLSLVMCPDRLEVPVQYDIVELDVSGAASLTYQVHDDGWTELRIQSLSSNEFSFESTNTTEPHIQVDSRPQGTFYWLY